MSDVFKSDLLKQTAVYWGNPTSDGYGGRTFDSPIEISVRWSKKQELFIDSTGQEVTSSAVVHVDRDLDIGGYLSLTISEEADPLSIDTAYEIRGWAKIPSLGATEYVRKVWL
jgi:hypothetical protein